MQTDADMEVEDKLAPVVDIEEFKKKFSGEVRNKQGIGPFSSRYQKHCPCCHGHPAPMWPSYPSWPYHFPAPYYVPDWTYRPHPFYPVPFWYSTNTGTAVH